MAQLFRYYQTKEKGQWQVTKDSKTIDGELRKAGAKRASILAVSAVVDESTDNDKLAYYGPFYIDIDSSDLQASIDSTRALVDKLELMGVPDSAYEIHASGSKGFHIYLHQTAFGQSRAVKRLPYIFREMAVDLYVPGLDFQVYCGGRGNLFRIPGVQREDGKYKTPIFKDELKSITPDRYKALVSTPRSVVGHGMQVQAQPVSSMVQLFESAKARESRVRKEAQKTPVSDAKLAPYADDPPECVRALSEYKIRHGINFNQAAYQFSIFLARAGTSYVVADSISGLLAKNGVSTAYTSERDRLGHVKGLTAYMRHQPHKQFSCAAMRAILAKPKCDGCQLYNEKQHLEEQYDVVERPEGYFALSAKGAERRLTNFILVPKKVVVSLGDKGNKRREYTRTTIERDHEFVAEVNIKDEEWNSRSAFLKAFTGVGDNLMVLAGDQDIQALKHFILRDIRKVDEEEVVSAVGIHRQMIGGKPRFTYVEPGMSVNKYSVPDTHLYTPKVDAEDAALPSLQRINRAWSGDDRHAKAIRNLLQVNEPEVVSAMFGWFMAAHLKAHVFGLRSEFPLLGVWGGRGSGKTQTSSLFGALHGCEFFHKPPPTFTAITEFAFLTHASASNTVPRIFDEFNKSGMGHTRYSKFSEYLKNLFNNSASAKGAVKRHTLTVDYHKPTSPTVILAEHQFEVPALRDRLYSVMVKEPSLRPRTKYFEKAKQDVPFLFQIAKESMICALSTREEWVADRLSALIKDVPERFSDRQRFCRATIALGLDFAERVLCDTMKLDLQSELAEMRQAFKEHVNQEKLSATGVGTTEIDSLLSKLAEVMILGRNNQYSIMVTPQNFKLMDDNTCLIDPVSVFPILKMYAAHSRDRMPLTTAGEFAALIKAEPYFLGEVMDPNMIQSRPVLRICLDQLESKGVDISAFRL